ncbi:expressed unknown protein [Seminavis robusta]|uniref:DUF4440 domain-containing protein n=1 Tax=Seminavis robusta TaxID=568900 RepID=A0A9N8DYD0_9STRA|nr:expressed unknown protein [Seminavis robusta]|eukprot:Sro472_g149960.1 n/a (211) ;mRNA; f:39908-40540
MGSSQFQRALADMKRFFIGSTALLLLLPLILSLLSPSDGFIVVSKSFNTPELHAGAARLLKPESNTRLRLVSASQQEAEALELELKDAEMVLRQAMLKSNVKVLDSLLDDNLWFTNHLGQKIAKEDDLNAHEQGFVDIQEVDLSDMKIRLLPPSNDVGVVTVATHIVGSFAGTPFDDTLRFTRIWQREASSSKWKIIAGHSSVDQSENTS